MRILMPFSCIPHKEPKGRCGFTEVKGKADVESVVKKDPMGRYGRHDEVLGRGGSKIVYKGFDRIKGTEIAWNQISFKPDKLHKLYSEVNLLNSADHQNIMKCFHFWVDYKNKNFYMITELCASGSLRSYCINKHQKVGSEVIKNWARQILKGLCFLHSKRIIHRDLKCDNLFVDGEGEVKIGDFGIAIEMDENRNSIPSVVTGTPEFIAPEVYREEGEFNELVDVYAFGMCLLELVTFEYPYEECKNMAQIKEKVTCGVKPLSLSKVKDPQLAQFIEKCLLPASQRPSATELLKDPFCSS